MIDNLVSRWRKRLGALLCNGRSKGKRKNRTESTHYEPYFYKSCFATPVHHVSSFYILFRPLPPASSLFFFLCLPKRTPYTLIRPTLLAPYSHFPSRPCFSTQPHISFLVLNALSRSYLFTLSDSNRTKHWRKYRWSPLCPIK